MAFGNEVSQAIFFYIAISRIGVQQHFKSGDNFQIATKITYAVVQLLDNAKIYLKENFKDNPSISSEYVKILASNTGYEHINKISVTLTGLQVKIDATDKHMKSVNQQKGDIAELKHKSLNFPNQLGKLENG